MEWKGVGSRLFMMWGFRKTICDPRGSPSQPNLSSQILLPPLPCHCTLPVSFSVLRFLFLNYFDHLPGYSLSPPLGCKPHRAKTVSFIHQYSAYNLPLKSCGHSTIAQKKAAAMKVERRRQIWELRYRLERTWWLIDLETCAGVRVGVGEHKDEPSRAWLRWHETQLVVVGWVWVGWKTVGWGENLRALATLNSPHGFNSPAFLLFEWFLNFAAA